MEHDDEQGRGPSALAGVDLNLLLALDALLTERSVSRAARRMSVSQPAMSGSLARLRRRLDDPLLVRRGRVHVPTTLAEGLVEPVREAVARVEAVLGAPAPFDPARDARTFTVAAADYVAVVLLRPLLAELPRRAPGVRLHVVGIRGDDALRDGTVDLAIRPAEVDGPRARTRPRLERASLFADRFLLAADRHNTAIDDLDLERFLALPYATVRTAGATLLERQLAEQGIDRRIDVTTETFAAVPLLLPGTSLTALVPARLLRALGPASGLRAVAPPVALRPLSLALLWDPRRSTDPAHRWLREVLLELAGRLEHIDGIDGADVDHRHGPFDLPERSP